MRLRAAQKLNRGSSRGCASSASSSLDPLAFPQRVGRPGGRTGVSERVSQRGRIAGGSGHLDGVAASARNRAGSHQVKLAGQQRKHLRPPRIIIREGV